MITTLHIKNIGIIDDLTLNLKEGLNVLTGETGAGKSLIIDSLQILCGGRFTKEMIRFGEEFCFVEACIYSPDSKYAEDGNIIVSREISLNGKNLCKINNRLVTVSTLKKIMSTLIDIHAQNENHKLMSQSNHIDYLDSYSIDKLRQLKLKYEELYFNYNEMKTELEKNFGDEKEKQRTLDLLTYQLNEIESANLKINEEELLENDLKVVQNSEKIFSNLSKSYEYLNGSVSVDLENTLKCLSKIEGLNENYKNKLNQIESVYYEIQDISSCLNDYIYEQNFEKLDSNQITSRLDLIYSLKRKYGNSIQEILEYKNVISDKIDKILNLEEYNNILKNKLEKLKEEMIFLCEKMHDVRVKNANILSKKINAQLADLEMKNASFKANIEKTNSFNENGLDKVEFVISTNLGEEYKSLTKIASGGELSRIMLAIKVVFSEIDSNTLIFDEIDSGISGSAAKAVSEKMCKIANNHQIICITHLAVVAAKADYNYLIKKEVKKNRTVSSVNLLDEKETLNEIARISSGEITEATLKYAFELKQLSKISA